MNNLIILDQCLLSNNVYNNFYKNYENVNFKTWLLDILPEIEDCKNQNQNNPWHIYNVLGHILHSVEEMNKQTLHLKPQERKLLAYTMFFHDIGKPASHITREKDGKIIDSFFGHNEKSAKIFTRSASAFGFNDIEKQIIEKLIIDHDIFMFIKDFPIPNEHKEHWYQLNNNLIESKIKEYNKLGDGKILMSYLLKVGKSDSLAQNPKMTKDNLKRVDKMTILLEQAVK